MTHLLILAAAMGIEAAIGYPTALFRAISHPVVWIGALIATCDSRLNLPDHSFERRRRMGIAGLVIVLAVIILPTAGVQTILLDKLPHTPAVLLLALAASTLLASRSLWTHVNDVAIGLEQRGLEGGREMVARIVGRNPQTLDQAAIIRAAIESLAENFSDGIVAPAFWCGVAGLPGIAAYKTINTADSMIGHRTPRHAAYGWAAARLDDVVNLPASRLSVLWIVLAAVVSKGADPIAALRAVWRDAGQHRSPNAGWPEAAMAGALGLRLAGPRVYGETRVNDAWMGCGRGEATIDDLRRALRLYRMACAFQFVAVVLAIRSQV